MAAAVAGRPAASSARQDDAAFFSVFPKTDFSTSTPESTPNIGVLASPGVPFGGPNHASQVADQAVQLSRAWSTATRFLTLAGPLGNEDFDLSPEFARALQVILGAPGNSARDLVDWYSHEFGVHFRAFVLPELRAWKNPVPVAQAEGLVGVTIEVLQRARNQYLGRLEAAKRVFRDAAPLGAIQHFIERLRRNLDLLLIHSLPTQRLQATLALVLFNHMKTSLERNENAEKCVRKDTCHCSISREGSPFSQIFEVGLGDALGERAFALAVDRFVSGPAIERRCFAVDWNGGQSVVAKLRDWVDRHFNPYAEEALASLTGNASFELPAQDKKQFDLLAVTSLGRLRTGSLFDYVKTWPDSTGAILDVKAYLNLKEPIGSGLPSEKAFVCQSFMEQIQSRFLHAGASTSDILSIYINVIHAFKTLDARGVLFGRVAAPIRNYLRAREDTANIIAASFLADVDSESNLSDLDLDRVCPDIALEVKNSTLDDGRDHKLLNWDDMNWVPDPIDAGPDYKSSKSDDVVTYILGLFEQDEFIKEVTNVLAQQLLQSTDSEYIKETRLVELLKSRLDATKLQAAEVMLKDVRDSVSLNKRLNPSTALAPKNAPAPTPKEIQEAIPEDGITLASLYALFSERMRRAEFLAAAKLVSHRRNDLLFPKRTRLPLDPNSASKTLPKQEQAQPNFKTQIVSSFFWPQLRSNEFLMPSALQPLQRNFERRFGNLGNQRKLHFRPALARVSLRLELEDRVVEENDLPGWRASVIDAFTAASADAEGTISLTAEQLMEVLEMEADLVSDALTFWTAKRVLYQPFAQGTYAVLERLEDDVDVDAPVADGNAVAADDVTSAVRSQDALLRESAPMFQIFIANMLRNGGGKEVGGFMGIASVLKMVNPSFTYGEEEVSWLLEEMEGRGEVRREGEMWVAV